MSLKWETVVTRVECDENEDGPLRNCPEAGTKIKRVLLTRPG